jgi:hypothetical protein
VILRSQALSSTHMGKGASGRRARGARADRAQDRSAHVNRRSN